MIKFNGETNKCKELKVIVFEINSKRFPIKTKLSNKKIVEQQDLKLNNCLELILINYLIYKFNNFKIFSILT